jgi:SAM-dependent methyltransferase
MFQQTHAVLPQASHDEAAREAFCATLRKFFTMELWPGVRDVYHSQMEPKFIQQHQRPPETIHEVEALLNEGTYFPAVNLLGRTAQEMLWDTVGESIERQLDQLIEIAKPKPNALGTLKLNPNLAIPRYVDAVDIHVMPGNFHTELGAGDIFAGALYDRGVHVFAFGGLGARNEDYGHAVVAFLKDRFPDLKPRRILDVGTGIGNVALPLADGYPEAEIFGIDIGAPMMRYAHARAESLGKKIHFSQQDYVATNFPDGYFDVVVSMLVTHEAPVPVLKALFKEINRILAPGGIMMHDGVLKRPDRPPFEEVMVSWFGSNANEPFTVGFKKLDFGEACVEAGFPRDGVFGGSRPAVYLQGTLPDVNFVGAVKTLDA